jgi:XTP/dITP diphosphohydrolase
VTAAPRRLYVATGNAGKVREIRAILLGALADLPIEILPITGEPSVRFPPEGVDYTANAVAKAAAVADQLGHAAVADDSGLEVDALGGGPGALSARYGGEGLEDADRWQRLLGELEGVPLAERTARFVCVAALVTPDGVSVTERGECEGRILEAPRGDGGFGYDPVFEVAPLRRAMAELGAEEKDAISHRARAFRALAGHIHPA